MISEKVNLSVVLLCYQEAENLNVLLPKIQTVLNTSQQSSEMVVIDTCEPKDNTAEICARFGAKYFNRKPTNQYGDAFRTALTKINGSWAVFMDADGSHPPEFIYRMLEKIAIDPEIDLLIASRYIQGGHTDNTKILVFMSRVLNWVYSKALGINCRDVSNSFRLYRTGLFNNLTLKCNHFDILEELLYRVGNKKNRFKIVEIPVDFKKRLHGESKRKFLVFVSHYLKTLIKLFFMRIFDKQPQEKAR